MILLDDIKSVINPKKFYGKKGERVELIADHGDVLIVKGLTGKFPVKKDKVSSLQG